MITPERTHKLLTVCTFLCAFLCSWTFLLCVVLCIMGATGSWQTVFAFNEGHYSMKAFLDKMIRMTIIYAVLSGIFIFLSVRKVKKIKKKNKQLEKDNDDDEEVATEVVTQ